MAKTVGSQQYPRIIDEADPFYGYLDESKIKQHTIKLSKDQLYQTIKEAISYVSAKSSRVLLNIPIDSNDETILKYHKKAGKDLFLYFKKYCGDPASSAFDCYGKHFSLIAKEQFRNRIIQKERMNAGWRYQHIAKDTATLSKRFESVSDIGTAEADFNAIIKNTIDNSNINIYVSVKNRTNTMGGQDWPKAIRALEDVARSDKNRNSPYICVFGIAMEKGKRVIRLEGKSKQPYSFNTEVWLSDYFWQFFSNFSYDEIIKAVVDTLFNTGKKSSLDFKFPESIINEFGLICDHYGLLDESGNFNDSYRLARIFGGFSIYEFPK